MKKVLAFLMLIGLTVFAKDPYDRTKFFGKPVYDDQKKLKMVEENDSQTHSKENYVLIRVKGIKTKADDKLARVRVAMWQTKENFDKKEEQAPFRAASHWAREANNGEMVFKIGGLALNQEYSFFAHLDKKNQGKVARNLLRIPTEPYIFSNKENQGKGTGLTREGISPPSFEKTLVKYLKPGQEIILSF